jgi:hypothetical protein
MAINKDDSSQWRGLFKLSGFAAMAIAILLVGEIVVFAALPSIGAPAQLLSDFSQNRFFGLLRFDLLGMISYALFIPVILAVCLLLRRSSASLALVGAALFVVAISIFFSTNTGFAVASLSEQYKTAGSDAERAMLLAACQSMITMFKVNTFMLSYVVFSVSWIVISIAMLKSDHFGKPTSWAGIAAGACGIVAEIAEHASAHFKWIAIALYFAAIVFLLFWILSVGLRLHKSALPSAK